MNMKQVVIYDENGRIFSSYITDDETNVPSGIPFLTKDISEEITEGDDNYRPLLKVDVSKEPHELVYGLTPEEQKFDLMTLDEYKELRQNENKEKLAEFLKANPLLWTDGLYYGVTQEDQDEMNLDFSTYQLKQTLGDTEWKLQWHSIKSVCRDFTMEEFCGLLNTIIEFVYPYRQLEMQYKEAIYNATTKEEISKIELIYMVENDIESESNIETITETDLDPNNS